MSLIKDMETNKFNLALLDKEEASVMIAFLENQRTMLLDDLVEIDISIRKLERWNGIKYEIP